MNFCSDKYDLTRNLFREDCPAEKKLNWCQVQTQL